MSKKLTRRQAARLEQLCDRPKLLSEEAITAFFAYTDRGIKPAFSSRVVLLEFDELIVHHHHGVESRFWKETLAGDFRQGLFSLHDFDSDRRHVKQAALKVYESVMGQTSYWKRTKDFWEL